jgi:hypothetical protein
MSKKIPKPTQASAEKTVFRKTGELIGTIGFHLAETGDKVMSSVSEEFSIVKKAIRKKLAKKKAPPAAKAKKDIKKKSKKKKAANKIDKRDKQIVKRTAKKSGKANKKK